MPIAFHRSVRHGRLGAFDRFVLDNESLVYNVAFRVLGEEELASRATQDTFSRSFSIFVEFRGEDARMWLLRIATGICHNQLLSGGSLCTNGGTASDSAQGMLCLLPPEQRITLVLSDMQGLSYREIAEATGVTTGIVSLRLSRARTTLRDALLANAEILVGDQSWPI